MVLTEVVMFQQLSAFGRGSWRRRQFSDPHLAS